MKGSLTALVFILLSFLLLPQGESATARKKTSASSQNSSNKKSTPDNKNAAKDESVAEEVPEMRLPVPPVDVEKWLQNSKSFQAGLKAMKDHMPDVAAKNFDVLLRETPPEEVVPHIQRQLAEAYIRSGDYDKGLELIKNNKSVASLPGGLFWEGMANKGKGRYSAALRLFNTLEDEEDLALDLRIALLWQMAEIHTALNNLDHSARVLTRLLEIDDDEAQVAARLALGRLYLEMNQPDKSRSLVIPLLNEKKKYSIELTGLAQLILAKVLVLEGNPQEALSVLANIINQSKMPDRIVAMAKLASAEAEISLEKRGLPADEERGKGEDRLLTFIENEPDSFFVPEAFNILRANDAFRNPEAYQKLQDWARGSHPQRTPLALATLARILMERHESSQLTGIYTTATEEFPAHPAVRDLQYLILQYLYDQNRIEDAQKLIPLLPEGDPRTKFTEAGLAFAKKDYEEAANLYKEAFNSLSDLENDLEERAAFNEYISALEAQLPSLVNEVEKSPLIMENTYADMMLEKALETASGAQEEAIQLLRKFITSYPDHRRVADAWLSLGEFALYLEEPDVNTTLEALDALSKLPLTDEEKERYARLQIILPEHMEQWPAAIQSAKDYLEVYREPHLQYQMQLKLGELLYRNNDYNQAYLYLQNFISQLPPDSPYLGSALFLSGKAAQQTNTTQSLTTALEIFEQVAALNSPYRAAAIIESASILMRQKQAREVIKMLDVFIGEKDLEPESRRLALALEAEAWEDLSSSEPEALDKAREMTSEILKEKDLPSTWRNRTLYLQASLSELAKDTTSALRDYHLIISDPDPSFGIPDWYWYYRAGFAAMNLLEEMKNWPGAISLAESMARAGGPRSEEAANRARKIRMEHFVWDDTFHDGADIPVTTPPEIPETLTLPDPSTPQEQGEQESGNDKSA